MNKLIYPFIAVVAFFGITGCSQKFKIAAPYKNITVVYGYLDQNDTAHYIRVQKAFLDQNKSALTMSQSPDSSFYANINVRINRMDLTGSPVDTIHLTRVDLDQEGYPKEPGVFFTAPNYAYKFKNVLNSNYIYRIVVTNFSTGQVDSADAPIIDDNSTDGTFNSSIFSDTSIIDFNSTLPNKFYEFFAFYTPPANYNFENQPTPAVIAQTIIRFNWDDSDITTHAKTPHSYDYNIGYQSLVSTLNTGQLDYQVPDLNLYYAVFDGMQAAPANTMRLLDKCNIFIYLGTQDFVNDLQSSLTQGVGLTGSEIEPVYTNIKGPDALGLFTSRGMRQGLVKISSATVDSLETSPILQSCNIRGTVY